MEFSNEMKATDALKQLLRNSVRNDNIQAVGRPNHVGPVALVRSAANDRVLNHDPRLVVDLGRCGYAKYNANFPGRPEFFAILATAPVSPI